MQNRNSISTSIKLSLDKRRKNTILFPIIYRLSHNTRSTSISTGYKVKVSDWDDKREKIKSHYKGVDSPTRLNNMLAKKMAQMLDIITQLADEGKLPYLSITELRERITNKVSKDSFFTYTQRLIDDMIQAKRIGNARIYSHSLKSVKAFRGGKDLSLNELNVYFLNRFEKWHLSKGNSLGGLSVYMRTIRAIQRKAIKEGIVDEVSYAFKDYTIKKGKPQKRAISLEAIRTIWHLELEEGTAIFRDRHIFMMSFLLNGMSYVDMAHLKLSNIVDGRVRYERQKTNEPYSIKIQDALIPILAYFTEGKKRGDYILPIITQTDDIKRYKEIEWARQRYNRNLKKIAALGGIEENVTSYVSRHSFASSADDLGVPVTAISKMLGHKEIGTTQTYLAGLRNSKMDDYQVEILEQLKGSDRNLEGI